METPETAAPTQPITTIPWWKDRNMLIPLFSGIFLVAGAIAEIIDAGLPALIFFWAALLLGGSTFVPGALKGLFTKGRLGIGLLMTISALGAVALNYVGEAAALAFLFSIAEALEDRAMDKAQNGLRALMELAPETATIYTASGVETVPASSVKTGDVLVISAGQRVATDGIIIDGASALDTSATTGESIPAPAGVGDEVAAGSVNLNAVLQVRATADGTDNSLTTIVQLVQDSQQEQGRRGRLADRIAKPLIPGVLILAVLVGAVGSIAGDPEVWVTRALVTLVAASPCAMAIAVPITVVSATGAASRLGVIIKSGEAFERLADVQHIGFDKTGTLTRNEPTVVSVVPEHRAQEILSWAAGLEQYSNHPLAQAIVASVAEVPPAQNVKEFAGLGLTGTVDGRSVRVGSASDRDLGEYAEAAAELARQGQSTVVVSLDGAVIGVIGIRDELRPEVPHMVHQLDQHGYRVSMLTGDNWETAQALAAQAGIGHVHAGLRPEEKAALIAEFSEKLPTAMVGDGINDAPALARADVGIAMGATGSDVAVESAQVAFMGNDLTLLASALKHVRRARGIINQNIIGSALLIAVLLPLAITGVLGLVAVVLVHEVAEIFVILNGLRANRISRRRRRV